MLREIFGKKLGMTQVFSPAGDMIGVTVVEVEPVCLLEKIDYARHSSIKIGVGKVPENKLKKITKPVAGYFKKIGVAAYKDIHEVSAEKGADFSFLTAVPAADAAAAPKREVGVEIFKEGEYVHVRSKTKGRGFQGGMKRHGWHGQPAAHGSMSHRRIGSAGSNTDPGRTIRGLRMPGHMGDKPATVRNLEVVKIDTESHLLFLKGSVPGARGNTVSIRKA